MFGKKKKDQETIPEDLVTLKPLFGIHPGIYLAILFSLIVLTLAFFFLIYPGLSKPGSMVSFSSEPAGAAVRVDDTYGGTTPCTVFVSRGSHDFTLVMPGFNQYSFTHTLGSRVFASRILPKKESFHISLEATGATTPLLEATRSFIQWSFAGEASSVYQLPRDLSEGAYRSPANTPEGSLDELLRASNRFVTSSGALREMVRAKFLVDSARVSPSPLTILEGIGSMLDYLNTTKGAAFWLEACLGSDAAKLLSQSDWYKKSAQGKKATADFSSASSLSIEVGGVEFHKLPGGMLQDGTLSMEAQKIAAFYMASDEISVEEYQYFLDSVPQWAGNKKDELVEAGLVGSAYLEPISHPAYPTPSVPGVSWYAAEAYCAWLTQGLPPNMAGYVVRLPTEMEWEYAALYGEASEGNLPFKAFRDGLWEWCTDSYAPIPYLAASERAIEMVGSPEKSLRGGSWVNPPGSVSLETRGSLPPNSSSPFVGFRPVVAEKTDD